MRRWLAALRERVPNAGLRRTLITGFVVSVVLYPLGTWWLLARGARGAEIATVLGLPVAVIGTVPH